MKLSARGGIMFYRSVLLAFSFFLAFILTGCFAHPYVGRSISRSVPHNKYYEGMPTKNSLCIPSTSGDNICFNYTLSGEGNTYTVSGEMVPSFKANDYPNLNLYLLLVNGGIVVDVIRLNTLNTHLTSTVKFDKTFTTDKPFRFVTFTYEIRYQQ